MVSRIGFFILIIFLVGTSCTAQSGEESGVTPTALLVTTTLPSTSTPAASETWVASPAQPTVTPVEGTTSTQVNVRAEPSTASQVLGMIATNTKVEILGKDPGGSWYQINYQHAPAVEGKGWVTAKYVTTAKGIEVPIVGGDGKNQNNGSVAIVQQQINVRSGPGTSFNSLGTLKAQDVVNLIGKDANGTWLQIEFAAGPDGKGWVNAAFVQAKGLENIPIIAEAGNVIGTETPMGIPPTPTATVMPAWADNDSQNNPMASVVFESLGTHALIYSGDVSAPQGDPEDWIQFTSYTDVVFASLQCSSNNLQVKILENGQPKASGFACGDTMKAMDLTAGAIYTIQMQAQQSTEGLQYILYTLKIEVEP